MTIGYISFLLVFVLVTCLLMILVHKRESYNEQIERVRLYSLSNYGGTTYSLKGNGPWELRWSVLRTLISDIKSFQIGDGYVMYAYEGENFTGSYGVFTGGTQTVSGGGRRQGDYPFMSNFISALDGKSSLSAIRSIKVLAITDTPSNTALPVMISRYNMNITCRNAQTGINDSGGVPGWFNIGTNFLDRHNIQCNKDEYLSRYTLRKANDGRIYYDYSCCTAKMENEDPSKPVVEKKNTADYGNNVFTPINGTDNFHSAYIDRHHIGTACINDNPNGDNSKLLSRVHFISHYNPNRMQYKYECTEMSSKDDAVNVRNSCRHITTPWVDEAHGVDNHVNLELGCDFGEGIRDLVMVRGIEGGKWKQRYLGWCCKPTFEEARR